MTYDAQVHDDVRAARSAAARCLAARQALPPGQPEGEVLADHVRQVLTKLGGSRTG
jgi:hypothetical protein